MTAPLRAAMLGTLAQIIMVASGHYLPPVMEYFALGGVAISALTGWLAMRGRVASVAVAAGTGALVGAGCALLGIGVSAALGDVPVSLLVLGTGSSAFTGLVGGVLARRR